MPPMPVAQMLTHRLSKELAAGEHIVWSGQPDAWMSMSSKWVAIPFGFLWTGATLGGAIYASQHGDDIGIAVGLLFACIGLYMLSTPAIDYLDAKGTLFALTERRLLVVRKSGRHIQSLARSGIRQVERAERNGRVTLRIPTRLVSDGDGGQTIDYVELHGIREADRVFRLLTQ